VLGRWSNPCWFDEPMRAVHGLALASSIGCSTYAQHRAALVPRNTPMSTDGQPLDATGMLGLGASNVYDVIAPTEGVGNVGDAVPSTQLRGEIALRITPNLSISGAYEEGIGATANPVTTSQPRVDNGDVSGAGIGMAYSIRTGNPHLRVGISTEVLFWSVPWVEYTSCSANCYGDSSVSTSRGRDDIPTLAFGVTPSYRTGPWTVYGGVTVRNQPTVPEKIETDLPDSDADVQAGAMNVMLHAGVEYAIADVVSASLVVHQTVTQDPIMSGPGIGLMVRFALGRDPKPASPSR
jgi:hypothetical protein